MARMLPEPASRKPCMYGPDWIAKSAMAGAAGVISRHAEYIFSCPRHVLARDDKRSPDIGLLVVIIVLR
jgi:hypothetical protein